MNNVRSRDGFHGKRAPHAPHWPSHVARAPVYVYMSSSTTSVGHATPHRLSRRHKTKNALNLLGELLYVRVTWDNT